MLSKDGCSRGYLYGVSSATELSSAQHLWELPHPLGFPCGEMLGGKVRNAAPYRRTRDLSLSPRTPCVRALHSRTTNVIKARYFADSAPKDSMMACQTWGNMSLGARRSLGKAPRLSRSLGTYRTVRASYELLTELLGFPTLKTGHIIHNFGQRLLWV